MNVEVYASPVDKLLTFGDCRNLREWPDYLQLGLGPEHIPEPIRMATSEELSQADSDSLEVWAPVHAWRALGQLHAVEAVEPLTQILRRIDEDHDEWVGEDVPKVFGLIGPSAIPVIEAYIADESHQTWARVAAITGIEEIGKAHPEARSQCVDALTRQLDLHCDDDIVNGSIVASLVQLKAVESAPAIERAFAAGCIDESINGDWEEVQIALGLKERDPSQPQKRFNTLDFLQPSSANRHLGAGKVGAKSKAKRRQARASRKKNRKR